MKVSSQLVGVFVVAAVIVALVTPQAGSRFLRPVEQFGVRLAKRKSLSICLVVLATALIRVGLLWLYPIPFPQVHDEFSYLLAGDTFAHGRLTNPPNPMYVYLDTFHVNQHPTYMSKYPPAQGAVLALGQLLGNPWIGVVFSVALMSGAILWMLQGWLPPEWALLGGILAVLRLGIFSYWMNSYWGGAVAAIGGALVVGALPRAMRFPRARDTGLLGLGAAILANSRPFEGLIFCIPVAAALMMWLSGRRSPSWSATVPRVVLPVIAVLAATIVFMGYYNWRGTGHPLLFPYVVNSRAYITAPDWVWEKAKAPLHYLNPQFDAYYSHWSIQIALEGKASSIPKAFHVILSDLKVYVGFLLWAELCLPLLALPWILTDKRVRFLVLQFAFCSFAFLLCVWFEPHYTAPLTATAFALLVQGMRHIRHWQLRGRVIGVGITRAIVLCAFLLAPAHRFYMNLQPQLRYRARFAKELNAIPGNHLVVVRYSSDHDPNAEWVYNRADIDRAKIVWARGIPDISLEPLLNYYRDRDVWVVKADSVPPQLLPYSGAP